MVTTSFFAFLTHLACVCVSSTGMLNVTASWYWQSTDRLPHCGVISSCTADGLSMPGSRTDHTIFSFPAFRHVSSVNSGLATESATCVGKLASTPEPESSLTLYSAPATADKRFIGHVQGSGVEHMNPGAQGSALPSLAHVCSWHNLNNCGQSCDCSPQARHIRGCSMLQ